jgi:acyl-CoA reductase-like NAD-dependent aldehyde dehydrogenase
MYTKTKYYSMYLAGEWATGEARMEATSPATGEQIGTVPEGTRADVSRAIAAANEAWSGWAALSAFERAAAMMRIAEIIEERRDDLAQALTLDQGKPLAAEAYDEVDELVANFEMASADVTRTSASCSTKFRAG